MCIRDSAELEQLRAEKAAREQAARAAAERAELDRLRAEKAQAQKSAEAAAARSAQQAQEAAELEPVSYTHLDVYKRQPRRLSSA